MHRDGRANAETPGAPVDSRERTPVCPSVRESRRDRPTKVWAVGTFDWIPIGDPRTRITTWHPTIEMQSWPCCRA